MKSPFLLPSAFGAAKALSELSQALGSLGRSPLLEAHDSVAKALTLSRRQNLVLEAIEKASVVSGVIGALSIQNQLNDPIIESAKALLTNEKLTKAAISTIGISPRTLEPSSMRMATKMFEAAVVKSLDNVELALKASAAAKIGAMGTTHAKLWSGIEMPSGIVSSHLYVSTFNIRRILDSRFERSAVNALTDEVMGAIRKLSRDLERHPRATPKRRHPDETGEPQGDTLRANQIGSDSIDANSPDVYDTSGRILLVNGDFSFVKPRRRQQGFIGSVPVFIGNADCDREDREELSMHLTSLRVRELIMVLGDADMPLARVVVLLLSAAYLDHLYRTKAHKTMEGMTRRGVTLLPVFLRDVVVEGTFVAPFKRVPSDERPISHWEHRDSAFVDVVKNLERVIHEITTQANGFPLKH